METGEYFSLIIGSSHRLPGARRQSKYQNKKWSHYIVLFWSIQVCCIRSDQANWNQVYVNIKTSIRVDPFPVCVGGGFQNKWKIWVLHAEFVTDLISALSCTWLISRRNLRGQQRFLNWIKFVIISQLIVQTQTSGWSQEVLESPN